MIRTNRHPVFIVIGNLNGRPLWVFSVAHDLRGIVSAGNTAARHDLDEAAAFVGSAIAWTPVEIAGPLV